MTEQNSSEFSPEQEQELQEWFAHTDELVNELLDDGSNEEKEHVIEHHFASSSFEKLEAAAVAAFKLGLEVDEPEEAELENGARIFCFDIVTEQYLDVDEILEETQKMFKFAIANNIDYDGWGTYFED